MSLSLYFLIAAGMSLLVGIFVQGLKEPRGGFHTPLSVESAEKKYQRWTRVQRTCWVLILVFLLAAATAFIVPRWYNLQRNLNKSENSTSVGRSYDRPFFLDEITIAR